MLAERETFTEKWQNERNQGLKRYYAKHIVGILAIAVGIVVGDSIARKGFRAEYVLIYIMIAALFPAISWFINEMRFKRLRK